VIASDGDPTVEGMLGNPANPQDRRIFFTEQHGNNQVWEVWGVFRTMERRICAASFKPSRHERPKYVRRNSNNAKC
jgi:hypothetical protein